MRAPRVVGLAVALTLALGQGAFLPVSAAPIAAGPVTRQIASAGTTSFQPAQVGNDAIQWPEFVTSGQGDKAAPQQANPKGFINRSHSKENGGGDGAQSNQEDHSNLNLKISFDGLNHRNQRLANGGNQFSLEPPDQGLCVGNGFVMETINDVLRVFDPSGNPLLGVVDLNTFYGYPPAIKRAPPVVYGPFITDPSCYYDSATQRWFQDVLTLDVNPANGDFLGTNHIDLAVSNSSSPLGAWTIYRIPVQDDGTAGTPNHGCSLGPCLGDYPHIGADANGFFVTTNEYSFFGPEFKSANIYAFSKHALASGASSVNMVQFDTPTAAAGNPGFTVWPATSPDAQFNKDKGGTEFFLSSDAAAEANGTGSSKRIFLWSMTNTSSLDTATPALALSNSAVKVKRYAIPPLSDQKPGDFPLGQCLNDSACATFLLGAPNPFAPEVLSHIDSNDTRMQQVTFADGKVWGALDTDLAIGGAHKAGIEWFIVDPEKGKVDQQGYLGLANNNLTYPAIGVTKDGRGVMAFTLVGADNYPSAAYAGISADEGVGAIHIAAAGKGPDDGFTSYKAFVGNPPRTRWGDYGAAVPLGKTVWIASEYIAQTCTLAQYQTAPFGSCGGTRTTLGNWATRISAVQP
jgi:hypothetical protein